MNNPVVITEKDVQLVKKLKDKKALLPINGSGPKRKGIIYVTCNGGEQIVDKIQFMKKHIAEAPHPVLSHGGAMRVSSRSKFFDQGVLAGVKSAVRLTLYNHHVLEGHFPCLYAAKHGLGLAANMSHCVDGWDTYLHFLNVHEMIPQEVLLTFHFDWRGLQKPQANLMETFQVNPLRMAEVLNS